MEQRPTVRSGRPIRETQVRPRLVFGLFPMVPASLTAVTVIWFCLVPGVYMSIPVGAFVLFVMWLVTMYDPFWFEIGAQKLTSSCQRAARTRGRSLSRRKYKAAR